MFREDKCLKMKRAVKFVRRHGNCGSLGKRRRINTMLHQSRFDVVMMMSKSCFLLGVYEK